MNPLKNTTTLFTALFLVLVAVALPQFAAAQSAGNQCSNPDFQITSDDQVYALDGESFSYYVVTENDTAYELSSSLPAGLSFRGGQILGTPQATGDFQINFVASNDCGSTTQSITLTVVDSGSAVAQTNGSASQAAGAGSVGLNEIPETGVVADTALTVGFYLLALLLLAGWMSRRLFTPAAVSSSADTGPDYADLIPSLSTRIYPHQNKQPPTRRRFGDGMRR